MNFAIAIITLAYLAAIKAKHKSDSSDVSSDSQNELSLEQDASDVYTDNESIKKSKSHHHKHSTDNVLKKPFESRRWHKNCIRKANKLCAKACEKAYKAVCKKRKCSKRAKRTLKKECKKSCTKNFEFDRTPDYEE